MVRWQHIVFFVCISTLLAQKSFAQDFHIVAPNTFRLDSVEKIWILNERGNTAFVQVYVQDHPGKIKNITAITLPVLPSTPQSFEVHIDSSKFPDKFFSDPSSEKYIYLIVNSTDFHKEIQIPISHQSGYVFIQTDKPIYSPKESAHIRIIPLTEKVSPSSKPLLLQIKNPDNVIVEEITFKKFSKPFVSHVFKFNSFSVLGEWSATVRYGFKLQQNVSVQFELKEYVLPTFTVDLKAPEVILESDRAIFISVDVKYVYGKKVQGMVTYRLGVKGDAPNTIFFAVIGPKTLDRDGRNEQMVRTEELSSHPNIGWFPEGSHLIVEASVVDAASGNKEVSIDSKGVFSKSPYIISFSRALPDFKPGLPSVLEANINTVGGKPAANVPARISIKADGNDLIIQNPVSTSNENGQVSFKMHPEMHHSVLTITVETQNEGYPAVGHFEQHKFNSRNKAFIGIERSSSHETEIKQKFIKVIHIEPPEVKDIYYIVASRGRILLMNKFRSGSFKIHTVEFELTPDMVPSFRLVVWSFHNQEMIADSLSYDIQKSCSPNTKISITPEFNINEPGSEGKIVTKGVKGTRVLLLGVDEAVYALSKKDLFTKEKLFKTLSKHDLGCGPGGGLNTESVFERAGVIVATKDYLPPPDASSCVAIKRRKRDIATSKMSSYDDGLEKECCALGMSHDDYGRTCEERTNILTRFLNGKHLECSTAFLDCCLHAVEKGFTEMKLSWLGQVARMDVSSIVERPLDFISIHDDDEYEKLVYTIRSDFREMWILTDYEIQSDNTHEELVSLPHSITTWVLQAVAISPNSGLCVAEPKTVVSFKRIFLQLNLPYAVVRNEQVEIQVVIFNYGDRKLNAIVYMYGVEDLCTGAVEGEKSERKRVTVEAQSAESVTFPVVPLKEGSFDLKVVALSGEGSDIVVRKLNVIPEGYLVEIDIPVKLDPSNQQKREKRDIDDEYYIDSIDPNKHLQVTAINLPLPQNFVPGTESCSISVIGDPFGPVIETALNDPESLLELPSGCGEQNMMRLAPTLYAMRYLKIKGKITPDIEEKGFQFMRTGYTNELLYRKEDGSFSAYQFKPTSTWLTAFVVKVFCQASELIHLEHSVMCGGVKWLIDNQQPDGSFVEHNPMYMVDMMGGVKGATPMTAFTLIALEECDCDAENLYIVKKRAADFLESHLGDVTEPLPVAIMAYALTLSNSALKEAAKDKLMSLSNYNADRNRMHWGTGDSAHDIEASAYALLTQILFNDMTSANSIVNWLNTQRMQSGCYKSTQDTVIGLQAMSEYAIRAQMPSLNLNTNISSSNDKNFKEVLVFNERNGHILQNIKVNKVGGTIFVNTDGQGVGSLSVKLRYNILNPPPEKLCKFDVTVNMTEAKHDNLLGFRNFHEPNSGFEMLEEDLIRGAKDVLNAPPDVPVMDTDPRNRDSSSTQTEAPRRTKREDELERSKAMFNIKICVRHLEGIATEMSIVDVGLFSGYEPHVEDLNLLQQDTMHLIDRYEKSSKGVVFYLRKIPAEDKYCFQFRVMEEYFVGKIQPSIIKVYDYYNPSVTCAIFYSPNHNSPMLRTVCDGGVCQCAEGGCPPDFPFDHLRTLDDSTRRQKLLEMACDNYDFVWRVEVDPKIEQMNGFYNVTFKVLGVIKEGKEKAGLLVHNVRHFLVRDNCNALLINQTYVIMGKDGHKYKDEQGKFWRRYMLDKTTAIHLWSSIAKSPNRDLQRDLNFMVKTLKREGCAS